MLRLRFWWYQALQSSLGVRFWNSLKAAVPPLLLAGGTLAAYCCPFPSLCQNVSQGQVMTHALEQS